MKQNHEIEIEDLKAKFHREYLEIENRVKETISKKVL